MATQSVVSKPSALVFLLFILTQAMVLGSPTSPGVDEAYCLEEAAAAARTPIGETGENKEEEAEEKQEAVKEEASGAEKNVDADEKNPDDKKGKKCAGGLFGSFIIQDCSETESESGSNALSGVDDEEDGAQEAGDDKEAKNGNNDNGSNADERNGNKRRKMVGIPDLNLPHIDSSDSESEN